MPQKRKCGLHKSHKGYLRISAGPLRHQYVHRIVAEAMLQRPLEGQEEVHHRDGDKLNCAWTNLLVLDAITHSAVSNRQRYYLKQKYSREEAAFKAYFDVTGSQYPSTEISTEFEPEGFNGSETGQENN